MAVVNPLVNKNLTEDQLRAFVIEKDRELDQDWNDRVSGINNSTGTGKKIAGYLNLRNFYEGDHWSYLREDGLPIRAYNYCRTTILNYTSFLANEAPEDDVPPRDTLDEIEIARAEEVEKLLGEIKDDNNYPTVFSDAAQNQSLLGDCFIFGPYIEWVVTGWEQSKLKDTEGNYLMIPKKVPRIRFKNIKRIENVRIFWSDEDFTEYEGFIFYYRVSEKQAERIYREQMNKRGITKIPRTEPENYTKTTSYPMTTIKVYWDDTYMLAMVGDVILDFVKHDWGFVPGLLVKNVPHPTRPWGVSDIEDMLDAQVEYNETAVDTRGKIKQVAVPHVFYSGDGEPVQYTAGVAQMIKIGENDRIFPDPMGQSTAPFEQYAADRKNDIHQLSMISEIFYGGAMTAKATGRALSVLMQGVNNKVKQKQQYWKVALQSLNANILRLIEIYFPIGKQLIQGYYKTDIFFPSILIRNVTEEINKFNMKLQSQYTTMKNLGIPNPKEEVKVMKREWDDQSISIEISRNPQLRMQLQQMIAQQMGQGGGQTPQAGGGNPQLTEGDGGAGVSADESAPLSSPGVPQQAPSSGQGAIAQKGFRGR